MKNLPLVPILICTFLLLNACKKPAGPGGKASVSGKVYAIDYDNSTTIVISRGYSSGEQVYISYGNSTQINDDVRTGLEGSYEFTHLNKGHYKVFAMSLDSAVVSKGNDTKKTVIQEFDITQVNQKVVLKDFVINK